MNTFITKSGGEKILYGTAKNLCLPSRGLHSEDVSSAGHTVTTRIRLAEFYKILGLNPPQLVRKRVFFRLDSLNRKKETKRGGRTESGEHLEEFC